MTPAQRRALEAHGPAYLLPDAAALAAAAAAHQGPVLLEIGFGNGEALLHFAALHRDWLCLGVEVHTPGVGALVRGAVAAGHGHVRALEGDAVEVLDALPPGRYFDRIHLFFPDPWHKKRHAKRRIVQAPFAARLAGVLRPGGHLRFATDWEPYAEHARGVLDAEPDLRNRHDGWAPRCPERPLTRFESRGERLGHGVHDLEYECCAPCAAQPRG